MHRVVNLSGKAHRPRLSGRSIKPVKYDIATKELPDASADEFYGRIIDRSSKLPIANAEISFPDLGLKTRSDKEGRYFIKSQSMTKDRVDWKITHPGYETIFVNSDPADTIYPCQLPLFMEPKGPVIMDNTLSAVGKARFMLTTNDWAGGLNKASSTICSTIVTVGEGELFGYLDLFPARDRSDTVKLTKIINDSTVEIYYEKGSGIWKGQRKTVLNSKVESEMCNSSQAVNRYIYGLNLQMAGPIYTIRLLRDR